MEMKKSLTINIEEKDYDDFLRFCDINGFDEDKKAKQCFTRGYNIVKYGTLSNTEVEIIEKEIIKEVPIEKIVEVVKEVEVEKIIEKEIFVTDNKEIDRLLLKIEELENKPPEVIEKEVIKQVENKNKIMKLQDSIVSQQKIIREKNQKILQLEDKLLNCNKGGDGNATFMRSSNIKY